MTMKYTKWAYCIPYGNKIYQHFSFYGPPKFTQIGNFGLKTYHLATLVGPLRPKLRRTAKQSTIRANNSKFFFASWCLLFVTA
jgi:hypothetical protein